MPQAIEYLISPKNNFNEKQVMCCYLGHSWLSIHNSISDLKV